MKKTYLAVFVLFLTIEISYSQLAPNFTVTDVHGVEHYLYEDYLDKGMTVVLDLFFVDCPPCNDLAPLLEPLYQEYGAGTMDVQFISLTSSLADSDLDVMSFEHQHGTTWPAVSAEGGGPAAQDPYTTGDYGTFYGYPTLVVIAPNRSVQFDAWDDGSFPGTISILDQWIANTGAQKSTTSIESLGESVTDLEVAPNPASDYSQLSFNLEETLDLKIDMINILGQQMARVFSGNRNAGEHSITLPIQRLENGMYLIRMQSKDRISTTRIEVRK